jgi:hypothetical protein
MNTFWSIPGTFYSCSSILSTLCQNYKKKLHIPSTVMDMVFMTQNFYAAVPLCFGRSSHSASFLHGWATHMFKNCIMYFSLQDSDPAFFANILFLIDSAFQIHWCSCCNSYDWVSVNDKVLLMQEIQDMIIRHNFNLGLRT